MFGLQIIDVLGFRVFFRLLRFPFFSEAAYSMGLVRYREKTFEEAVVHFKKALEINPYHEKASTGKLTVKSLTYYILCSQRAR